MSGKRVRLVMLAQVLLVALLWPTASSAEPAEPDGPQEVVPFTGLTNPTDVEVDAIGNVYVADSGNNRVVKLPAGGGPQQTLGFTGLNLNYFVNVAPNGDVYASDQANDKVVKLPAGGGPQADVITGVNGAVGMDIDAAGTLYVAGQNCNCVKKKTAAGVESTLGFTGLSLPSDVELDAAGNVYVSDAFNKRVVKLPVGGGPQVVVPITGLTDPYEVAFDADGNLLVMDAGQAIVVPPSGPQSVLPFAPLQFSSGIAIDGLGTTYVTDNLNDRVLKLPAGKGTVGNTTLTWNPRALAIDTSGNRYAVDQANSRVVKITPGGTETVLPFTGLANPFGIAVDSVGNVYLTDSDNARVLKLPPGGSPSTLGFTGLDGPSGIAVDSLGNVYVGDSGNARVLKLPIGGGAQVTLPFTGLGGVGGITFDSTGALLAIDAPNHRVVKLPAGGGAQVDLPFTGLNGPQYIAVDRDQNVYVTDYFSSLVIELAGGGDAQLNPAFPTLSFPTGLAVDSNGILSVSDTGNHRILKLITTAPELRVTTNPAVGTDIIVDGIARDSWGLNWAQFTPGSHQVCFGEVLALQKPACQTVNLNIGATTVVQGNYTANGYLRALTSPALPSTITVGGVPRNEYGLWAEVAPGTYNVCFGAVQGYNPPACRDVVVTAGATATTTGTFTSNPSAPGPTGGATGYLRAVTNPAVGAMISIDGQWRDHWGLNWVKIPVGAHEVCFGPVLNMTAPACQSVTVTNGNTSTVTGNYTAKGFLRVSTSPAVHGAIYVNRQVADNWGMWTNKPAGSYEVCFGPVPGYVAPPCQPNINVTNGNTTNVTGTYTASG